MLHTSSQVQLEISFILAWKVHLKCSWSWNVMLWCYTVPVHSIHYRTLFSDSNSFEAPMVSFHYAIPCWYMYTTKSKVGHPPPLIHKLLKHSTAITFAVLLKCLSPDWKRSRTVIYERWAMFTTTMTDRHTVVLPTPTLVLGLYIGMLHIQWPLPKLTKTTVHQNYVLDFIDTEPVISCLERRMVLTSYWYWSPFPGILKKCSLLYSISIITLCTACVQVWLDTSSLLQTD